MLKRLHLFLVTKFDLVTDLSSKLSFVTVAGRISCASSVPFRRSLFIAGITSISIIAHAADWQWSVPVPVPNKPDSRAFLWIPPHCNEVRAVVVGQHNMIEQGILEHPAFRKTLAELSIGEIWVAPPFDGVFKFDQGAGAQFETMMKALAKESGYAELDCAPIIPIGHSACASYPWNFAAWNPARTLAVLSVHGDAPLTNMTGSGHPNPNWGARNIDGVPGLMVMAEYEWLEGRLQPAIEYRARHPKAPIAVLAEPGRGHFDYSDQLVDFLALFIRKAAEYRLSAGSPRGQPPVLKPVESAAGWLVERWTLNRRCKIAPAPVAKYRGDPAQAFWAFDEETAKAIQNHNANQIGKQPQLLGFLQDGKAIPQVDVHQQVNLGFTPLEDGITFRATGTFLDSVEAGSKNLARWTGLPVGSPLGHATGGRPIAITKIVGPVAQLSPDTFTLRLDRNNGTTDRRNNDIWLLASHPGDDKYKSAVQQALMRIAQNKDGAEQHIEFPPIPDQKKGAPLVELHASSDARLPVNYYVREGPAEVSGNTLKMTAIPPRSRFPLKVTVVAWQWGRPTEPKIRTAAIVERTFLILNSDSPMH